MRQPGIIGVAQPVIGMRIERYVHHRPLRLGMRRHPTLKILINPMRVDRTRTVIVYFVGIEQAAFLLVYLFSVVSQGGIERVA